MIPSPSSNDGRCTRTIGPRWSTGGSVAPVSSFATSTCRVGEVAAVISADCAWSHQQLNVPVSCSSTNARSVTAPASVPAATATRQRPGGTAPAGNRASKVFGQVHGRGNGDAVERRRRGVRARAGDAKRVLEAGERVGVDQDRDARRPRLDQRLQADERVVPARVGGEPPLDQVGGVRRVGGVGRILELAVAVRPAGAAKALEHGVGRQRVGVRLRVRAGVVERRVRVDELAAGVRARVRDVRRFAGPGVAEAACRLPDARRPAEVLLVGRPRPAGGEARRRQPGAVRGARREPAGGGGEDKRTFHVARCLRRAYA